MTTQSEHQVLLSLKDRASQGLKSFGGGLDNVSKQLRTAGLAMTAFAGASIFVAKGFVEAALEQQRALNTLGVVVSATGANWGVYRDAVLEATAAIQDKTNFGDEEQLRILARMIPILGDVNLALEALPAILDAASSSSRGAAEVATTLTRALAGQANTAESIGLTFEETADFSERLAIVLGAVGGAAEANADPLKQLGNTIGDMKEAIGRGLLPLLIPLAEGMRDLADRVSAWADAHPELIRNIAKAILLIGGAGVAAGLISVLLKLVGVIKTVVTSIAGLAIVMGGLSLPMLALVAVFVGVLVAAVLLRDKLGPIFEAIGKTFAQFINAFVDSYNQLITLANTFRVENHEMLKHVEFNWRSTGEAVGDTIQDYMDVVTGAISAFKTFGSVTQEVGAETIGWMGRMGQGFQDFADDTGKSNDALDELGHRLFEVDRVTGEFLIPQIQSRNLTKEMLTVEDLRNNVLAIMAERTKEARKEQELLNAAMNWKKPLSTQAPGVPFGFGGAPPGPPGLGSEADKLALAISRKGRDRYAGWGRYIRVEGRVFDKERNMFLDQEVDEALGDAVLDAG